MPYNDCKEKKNVTTNQQVSQTNALK